MTWQPGMDAEPRILSSFEKIDELSRGIRVILSVSLESEPTPDEDMKELIQLHDINNILSEYQEQPYLLDPHLESIIIPIVESLRTYAKQFTSEEPKTFSSARVHRLAAFLYNFMKFRGYKAIIRFFPHEISDLRVAIRCKLSAGPVRDPEGWALRYLLLLWLSIVCTLPFDLAQFDSDDGHKTAAILEDIAKDELNKPGLEREGASLLLSRLYSRKDTHSLFESFLSSVESYIQESDRLFACIGSLKVLAEICKSSPLETLHIFLARIRAVTNTVSHIERLNSNALIRKLRTKLVARVGLRMLYLNAGIRSPDEQDDFDWDVPSEIEDTFEELFKLLQDSDTNIRWSAAKGLSRICQRLPMGYIEQVTESILGIFHEHFPGGSLSNLSPSAEHPWHGASLACAELARRNLIPDAYLSEVVSWMLKALFFDVQKGSFSIGSNVRDAAAYVIWSLARSIQKKALEHHALEVAKKLITVALFDREVHIRRAASAAFQENVGRIGLFPHGITVLTITDFYSVGIRRNAFLVAAPQVAVYDEYLQSIIDHLLTITLRHWDGSMRHLGAQSLRKVCERNIMDLGPNLVERLSALLTSTEVTDVHGALLALSELAQAFDAGRNDTLDAQRRKIFDLLDSIPSTMLFNRRQHIVTEAACYVVANNLSAYLKAGEKQTIMREPLWRAIIAKSLRHQNEDVQEAGASAMSALKLKQSPAMQQQSLARVLGSLDYLAHDNGFQTAISCLLDVVNPNSPEYFRDVKARRIAYTSLAAAVTSVTSELSSHILATTMDAIYESFFLGLDDYTINERGDVGSWVRLACIRGLSQILATFMGRAQNCLSGEVGWPTDPEQLSKYLSSFTYHRVIGALLKQGVERLDNVRQCVGEQLNILADLPLPPFVGGEEWTIKGKLAIDDLFGKSQAPGWNDGGWLFPRAIRLLSIEEYRLPVLKGLVLSISSKTSTTQRAASSALIEYARSLLVRSQDDSYDLLTLMNDLLVMAEETMSSNAAVIPVLRSLNVIIEGDILSRFMDQGDGDCALISQRVLALTTKNVERLKNVERVELSMKIVTNMLPHSSGARQDEIIAALGQFLQHRYPKIRHDTAETLYLVLQTKLDMVDEGAEQLLLETEWSTGDVSDLAEPVNRIISCLKA